MAGEHALFSASGAHMWAHCLGALAYCQGLPEGGSSVYAAEGTVYHEIAAEVLSGRRTRPYDLVGTEREADGFQFIVTRENLDHMMTYVNAVRERTGAKLYEVKLDTSGVMGISGQFGTGDTVILEGGLFDPKLLDFANGEIEVKDLKFGVGERVDAYIPKAGSPRWMGLNDQLMIYLCAAYLSVKNERNITKGRLGIHQPRHANGHFDEAEVTVEEMEAFIAWITDRAAKAKALLTATRAEILKNLTPGDKTCRWCPKKDDCEGRQREAVNEFDDVSGKDVSGVSNQVLGETLIKLESISKKLKDFKAEATRRTANGMHVPGWRMSEPKLGDRQWADPKRAEAMINAVDGDAGNLAYTKAFISPTEAERRLKANYPAAWAVLNGNPDKKTKQPTTETHIKREMGQPYLVRDFGDAPPVVSPGCEFEVITPPTLSEFM